jgi:hypothetical protein
LAKILVAEVFDDLRRPYARLAEGEPAVAAQLEILGAQQDLGVALFGDVGAVGAVVDQDEALSAVLNDRAIVEKLFDDLGPRYAKRNGGYLRVLKSGFRKGDNAPLALVTLMDRVEESAAAPA